MDDFLMFPLLTMIPGFEKNKYEVVIIYPDGLSMVKLCPMDPWPLYEKVRLTLQIIVNYPLVI